MDEREEQPDEAEVADEQVTPESAGDGRSLQAAASRELQRQSQTPLPAGLYIVATPIGNLGDITLRALTILARADVIYCEDTRHSRTLLAHYAIRRPLRPYHEHNAEVERPRIIEAIAAGRNVALISDAGTPLISDPGYKLTRAAIERNFPVVALPGASAILAGLVVSGLPTDTIHFAGFLPPKDAARRERFQQLALIQATVVLFESPTRLAKSLRSLAEIMPAREIVVARELTKKFEEIRRGVAPDVAAWAESSDMRGEIVLMIAPPPARTEVRDEEVLLALRAALEHQRLKDAARAVADHLGVSRTRVYDLGLTLKAGGE